MSGTHFVVLRSKCRGREFEHSIARHAKCPNLAAPHNPSLGQYRTAHTAS